MSNDLPNIGEKWHWLCEPRRTLIYVGQNGYWHQFEQETKPGVVWCEVSTEDLRLLEKESNRE